MQRKSWHTRRRGHRWEPIEGNGSASSTEDDHYTFNALGEVLTAEDRNGSIHTYSRDVLARMTVDAVTTLGSGVDPTVRRLETAYDGQGNAYLFTSESAASGGSVVNQVQREFNGLGQMTKEYQEHGGSVNTGTSKAVSYAFSLESSEDGMWSRLTSMTYPNASVLNYDYGSEGSLNHRISRLNSIMNGTTAFFTPLYLGVGTVVQRENPKTTMTSIGTGTGEAGDQYVGLDRFGRVVDLVWKTTSGGTERDHFQYGYDRGSNRLWRDNLVNTAFGELYTYDGLNQLATFSRGTLNGTHTAITGTPTRTQTWAPDAPGNFISVVTDGLTQSRSHDRQNQITNLGGATPTYDHNGNLTYDGTFTIAYDAWNRLVSSENAGGFVYTHIYDALGRRIAETKDNSLIEAATYSERHFYYNNAWQVIEERKGTQPSTLTEVLLAWDPTGSDRLIYRDRDSAGDGTFEQRLYVQQDAQGNVTALIDTAAAAVERYVQDPYGVVKVLTGSWVNRSATSYEWKYYHQGLRLDLSGTLYDNRARFYSPILMRFVQEDPIGFAAADQNTYRYVGDNPTDRVDPLGLLTSIHDPRSVAIWNEVVLGLAVAASRTLAQTWLFVTAVVTPTVAFYGIRPGRRTSQPNAGSSPGTNPGASPGMNPGTNPGTSPGGNPGSSPGSQPHPNPNTRPQFSPRERPPPREPDQSPRDYCQAAFVACLETSLADLPGGLGSLTRCGFCREWSFKNGGVWKGRVPWDDHRTARCDYWNLR